LPSRYFFPKGNKIDLIITPTMSSPELYYSHRQEFEVCTHKPHAEILLPRMGIITKCNSTNETLSEPFVSMCICVCVFFKKEKPFRKHKLKSLLAHKKPSFLRLVESSTLAIQIIVRKSTTKPTKCSKHTHTHTQYDKATNHY